MTAEELLALKEIVTPLAATVSTVVTATLAYFQSKCRKDLDIAYGEIRYLKTGRRTVRKPGQFWRRKKNREMIEVDEGIDSHHAKDDDESAG